MTLFHYGVRIFVGIFYQKLVRVRYGSLVLNQPLDISIEQFLSMLRFENKGKLDDLGIEIDTNTQKLSD